MKLKFDEQGHVVVQDGKPVYVHDDGKEVPFDAPQALAKIGGFMLGPHLSTQNTAMIYSTDQASTHAFFQANLESHSFKPVI